MLFKKQIVVLMTCLLLVPLSSRQTENNIVDGNRVKTKMSVYNNQHNGLSETAVIINQLGFYANQSGKTALFSETAGDYFEVISTETEEIVYSGEIKNCLYSEDSAQTLCSGDFSSLQQTGSFYIKTASSYTSAIFRIYADYEELYANLKRDALNFITRQRCQQHGYNSIVYASLYQENRHYLDTSGGWHDAGDYGKYTITATKTINDLLLSAYLNQQYGNKIDNTALLAEADVGLRWLQKMQLDWGSVYSAAVSKTFPSMTMAPDKDWSEIYVLESENATTATAGFSFALAYLVYTDIDQTKANEFLFEAIKAYNYAIPLKGSEDASNPFDINAGDYKNDSDLDELFALSSILYIIAQSYDEESNNTEYAINLDEELYRQEIVAYLYDEIIFNPEHQFDLSYDNNSAYGAFLLLLDEEFQHKQPLEYKLLRQRFLAETGQKRDALYNSQIQTYIHDYIWGGNMDVADNGVMFLMAYQLTKEASYLYCAQNQLSYLLGKNNLQQSYVVAYGYNSPHNIHYRPTVSGYYSLSQVAGALVGGPDGYGGSAATPRALRYYDSTGSYNTNEVTIYYNSAFYALLNYLQLSDN